MCGHNYHNSPYRQLNLLHWQRSPHLHLLLDRKRWYLRSNQLHCSPVHSIYACFEFDSKHGRLPIPRPFRDKQHPPNLHLGRYSSGHLPGKSLCFSGSGWLQAIEYNLQRPSGQRSLLLLPLPDDSGSRPNSLGQLNQSSRTNSCFLNGRPNLGLQFHLHYYRQFG